MLAGRKEEGEEKGEDNDCTLTGTSRESMSLEKKKSVEE